jgi:RND family efflux transporter MFP subunit
VISSNRVRIAATALGAIALAGGGWLLFGPKGKSEPAQAAEGGVEAAQGPPPANVVVAEAVEARLSPLSEAPGSVVSLRDSLIAAATSGQVEWVADVGAEVEEGAVIARIDAADARFARDEAAADVGRLKARATYLDTLLKRYLGLGEDAGESAAAIDQMRADRDQAAQDLARARVALDRAGTNLQRTEVKAPFAGRLVAQETQIGEYVSPGSPIARLVDTRHLEVTAQAPASLLKSVEPGDEIEIAQGTERIKAPIRAIVPVGDQVTRTLEIRLALPTADWNIGSAVRVSLPQTAPRPVVAAHRDAIVLRADKVSVYRVGEDMIAKEVEVELGTAEGDLIEVIGDVKAGDRLVIRGGERLRDGQAVTIGQLVAGVAA